LVFDQHPPYTILATNCIDFPSMQRLVRFARYWDLIANSGRFARTLPLILNETPFDNFMALSDWLYAKTDATHRIALDRLAALVTEWLCSRGADTDAVNAAVNSDYAGQNGKSRKKNIATTPEKTDAALPQRQARHLAA
jgi:hypothetical protein